MRLLLLCTAGVLSACCPRPLPKAFVPLPNAGAIVSAVRHSRSRIKNISADAKVDTFTRQGRAKVREVLVAERGGRLRFETLSPFEQPLSTLASDGKRFQLYDLGKRRFYHGPAKPRNISRLLPIRMEASAIAEILLGSAPVIRHDATNVKVERCESSYRVALRTQSGDVRQILDVDAIRLVTLRSRVYVRGDLLYELRFEEYRPMAKPLEKVLFPMKIRYLAPGDQVDLLIAYSDVNANETFEDSSFHLDPPRGVEVIPLDD